MDDFDKICNRIINICEDETKSYKDNKDLLIKLYHNIMLFNEVIIDRISLIKVIDTHRKLSFIKNRKASFIEEEVIRATLKMLPFIWDNLEEYEPKSIEILNSKNNSSKSAELSFILMEYCKEILSQKEDKSKRYKKRIKETIGLLNGLSNFYIIPDLNKICWSRVEDKDEAVQFMSLIGLENYYLLKNAKKITKLEVRIIEKIANKTEDMSSASTCYQILINAGVMTEFDAVLRMDNWKDNNF